MSQAAEAVPQPTASASTLRYEQPLNERMRTFLRLEFLYKQLLYHTEQNSSWSSRGSVSSLLDIIAILSRGDVRGDVLKELERQLFMLDRLQKAQQIDENRLHQVMTNLQSLRAELNSVGPKYLQELRDSEFLNAIRHRNSIPGGTCAFDLPEYTHWLRQDYDRRSTDIATWMEVVRPLCDSVVGLLWLVRNSKQASRQVAIGGVYQHSMNRDNTCTLVQLALPAGSSLYPEISGGQHRFTVRLMHWHAGDTRPVQTENDIEFELTVC
ncbi:MAG: cell division protein ZapD [Chromatiales bacterium]|jgi:cell division protein ZapD|nr:cell division protein ZapD [Chromatiales bacterium]MDP6151089.1 cell division protein ZapD [Gammaproteobacteria bacterium]MDP7093826.1 cell division protein ZapD [Gammaproteobacteria bacterium]MDP7270021.1 cell division protein ZapD [Gammaproteobacteria bacterium]HJP04770.1 cell division protein ZapD [Gammaproteobacteria bacterium]